VVHRDPFLRRNLVIRVIHRDAAFCYGRFSRIEDCRAKFEHSQRVAYAFHLATTCHDIGGNMIFLTPSRSEAARVGTKLQDLADALAFALIASQYIPFNS